VTIAEAWLRHAGSRARGRSWDNEGVDHDAKTEPVTVPDPRGTDITDLGHEVFQIDTRMAGYGGITAGYLIRGDRPCLVETGTAPSAPVVRDALG
jgi:hypothetical protein